MSDQDQQPDYTHPVDAAGSLSAPPPEVARPRKKPGRRAVMDAAIERVRAELPTPQYLDTVQAAAYLGLTRKQLESWRKKGCGPAYSKLGRLVRYWIAELDAWMAERRVTNTAQVPEAVAS